MACFVPKTNPRDQQTLHFHVTTGLLQFPFQLSLLICRTSWWFHLELPCMLGFTNPSAFPLCFPRERSTEADAAMRNLLQEHCEFVASGKRSDSPGKALGHMLCFVWKFSKAEEDTVESVR
jgi:hypothetical protein